MNQNIPFYITRAVNSNKYCIDGYGEPILTEPAGHSNSVIRGPF